MPLSSNAVFSTFVSEPWRVESQMFYVETFIPDTVHNNLTFNAEGVLRSIACTDSKGHTHYRSKDSQGQRPAELEVAIKDMSKLMAYRYGTVSGIQSPLTLPGKDSFGNAMDLNPGRVVAGCSSNRIWGRDPVRDYRVYGPGDGDLA